MIFYNKITRISIRTHAENYNPDGKGDRARWLERFVGLDLYFVSMGLEPFVGVFFRYAHLVDEFGSQFFNMPKLSFRFAFLPAIGLMFKSYSSHLNIIGNQTSYGSKISYAQNTRSAEFRELKPL